MPFEDNRVLALVGYHRAYSKVVFELDLRYYYWQHGVGSRGDTLCLHLPTGRVFTGCHMSESIDAFEEVIEEKAKNMLQWIHQDAKGTAFWTGWRDEYRAAIAKMKVKWAEVQGAVSVS